MNEPVTPTTPEERISITTASEWRAALMRCEAQVTERDEKLKILRERFDQLVKDQKNAHEEIRFRDEQFRKLTEDHHKLLNDYRCTLATLKAAVEVAQYELEYVTLNQAKPSV